MTSKLNRQLIDEFDCFLINVLIRVLTRLRRIDIAVLDVVLLSLSIAGTITVFYPIETRAALLLVPYLCWVSFAGLLNFTIWQMNRAPRMAWQLFYHPLARSG